MCYPHTCTTCVPPDGFFGRSLWMEVTVCFGQWVDGAVGKECWEEVGWFSVAINKCYEARCCGRREGCQRLGRKKARSAADVHDNAVCLSQRNRDIVG